MARAGTRSRRRLGAAHDHLGLALVEHPLGGDELDDERHDQASALLQRLRLGEHALDAADVEERLLGHVVELAVDERLEALDRLLDRHEDAGQTGEDLADEERLRQEPLDLAGPGHRDLVLLGELVETEDGDDVLELLVPLQRPPATRRAHVVVTLAHDLGRQDVRRRRQRVDRRVDAERRDLAGELGGRVEVGERGERRRVGVVVGGHVHGLQRRDRVTLGRGDALLQLAHLVGERRLVAHGRRHAAEQRRHLGTGLHEPEDVVDEEQHVLVLHVAEVLGDGERATARRGGARPAARPSGRTRARSSR